jgi:hypothetical protein
MRLQDRSCALISASAVLRQYADRIFLAGLGGTMLGTVFSTAAALLVRPETAATYGSGNTTKSTIAENPFSGSLAPLSAAHWSDKSKNQAFPTITASVRSEKVLNGLD